MNFPQSTFPLAFPKETYYKTNYIFMIVVLDSKPKTIRIIGDYLSVVRLFTNADLNKVYIGFNRPPEIPLIEVAPGVITPFYELNLTWEDSEKGKRVAFLIGQEARFTVSREGVVILNEETLSLLIRWGRYVKPIWIDGSEVVAPPANTELVSVTVAGNEGYIYGFCITCDEANDFLIQWISKGISKSLRVKFPDAGSMCYTDHVPINEGSPADKGTKISIVNVNAGSANVKYSARILYAEV